MFGENLKYLRRRHDMKQIDLAYELGHKSSSSVSEWEKGKYTPKLGILNNIAKIFNVSIDDLMEKDLSATSNTVPRVPFKEIPVLSKISAGMPLYAEQNIIDYTYISETTYKNGKEYFGLIVSGDSMDKEFRENDVVIVEKDGAVENGEIGIILVNGNEATVKRVRYMDDSILLMPESNNAAHEPQIYKPGDELSIIGKVVGLNRSY